MKIFSKVNAYLKYLKIASEQIRRVRTQNHLLFPKTIVHNILLNKIKTH